MPAMDYQGGSPASAPLASLGRSFFSIRRDQIHAVDSQDGGGGGGGLELDAFQRHVADLFQALTVPDPGGSGGDGGDADLLSLPWVRKLLDAFLLSLEEFRVVLFTSKAAFARPPLDRLLADFFDRAVKALDVCNAVRDGINRIQQWHKHLEIAAAAGVGGSAALPLGEGQIRRARKAIGDLAVLMLDEKEGSISTHRNRSFGRSGKDGHHHGRGHHRRGSGSWGGGSHFRSHSWSVSRSFSAARQLQAIGGGLVAPRPHEITATGGLTAAVFTMGSVLFFVMWALVAAIPCQDRGLQTHFCIPRSGFPWATPIHSMHDKILEESKKKDRKNSSGLLKEIRLIEKCIQQMVDGTECIQFPMEEEKENEVKEGVVELTQVCKALKDGLDPLERQVREVFNRIIRSRTEGLDCLSKHDLV